MTGAELIALLQELTPEQLQLPVYAEGCDCTEQAHGINVDEASIEVARHWPQRPAPNYVKPVVRHLIEPGKSWTDDLPQGVKDLLP